MVRKIETGERRRLDPSTVCDLLSAKINNDMTNHVIQTKTFN